MIPLTLFRKPRGIITKTLTRLPTGVVRKDSSECAIRAGSFCTLELEQIRALCAVLENVRKNECLAYGVCSVQRDGKVASQSEAKLGDITRTKDKFVYRPGQPALLMLDYDQPEGKSPISKDEWLMRLYEACPSFESMARVWRASTSSFIYDKTGNELRGLMGQRLYFAVVDGSDIPRAGEVLFKRLWLNGHGHIEISKAGAFLKRAPIDAAVFSPERLDFVAGAVCKDGLRQGDLTPTYIDGDPLLNTRKALPDLTPDEEAEYRRLVEEVKALLNDKAESVRGVYIDTRAEEIASVRRIPKEGARQVVEAAMSESADILPDFLLKFDKHGWVPVADVLANLKAYDGATLADPLEPDYNGGRNVARLYANDGKPVIHSFAHGGKKYFLRESRGSENVPPDDELPPVEAYDDDPEAGAVDGIEEDTLALEFVGRNSDLIYVPAFGRWRIWNGHKWITDGKLVTFSKTRKFTREIAGRLSNPKAIRVLLRASTIAAVERLARCDERCVVDVSEVDANLWLLNTPAGIIDLTSGVVRPNDPKAYMTRSTAVGMDNRITQLWDRFLRDVTDDNPELILYLQKIAGYALTGSTREHVLFFFYGTGGNGKGVFLNTLTWVLADYATVAPMTTFTESRVEQHPTDLALLHGARLVTAQETKQGQAWAEGKIKQMTGGDPITARFMRQDFFTYQPQFKLLLSGNHKPTLKTVDESVRRRFRIVPFTVTIPETRRDRDLPEKLKAEWPGILRWAVEGCLRWQREGLEPPEAVKTATEQYLVSMDVFSEWLFDRCEVGKDFWDKFDWLYKDWCRYAEEVNESPGKRQEFSESLERNGFYRGRNSAFGRHYVGLKLKHKPGEDQENRRQWAA